MFRITLSMITSQPAAQEISPQVRCTTNYLKRQSIPQQLQEEEPFTFFTTMHHPEASFSLAQTSSFYDLAWLAVTRSLPLPCARVVGSRAVGLRGDQDRFYNGTAETDSCPLSLRLLSSFFSLSQPLPFLHKFMLLYLSSSRENMANQSIESIALPLSLKRRIIDKIYWNKLTIIVGPTGCGKLLLSGKGNLASTHF